MTALNDLWADRVHEAIRHATREHASHLEGVSFPSYDGQGLHVWSVLCGEIRALEGLAPELFGHPAVSFDPVGMRRACREGAIVDYEAAREQTWRLRMLLERRELAA